MKNINRTLSVESIKIFTKQYTRDQKFILFNDLLNNFCTFV